MELPLAVRFKQLKATSKETVGVYRSDFLLTVESVNCCACPGSVSVPSLLLVTQEIKGPWGPQKRENTRRDFQ